MDIISTDINDIKQRLSKLMVFKLYGPDMRILKEVRNEIDLPLKLIFECSISKINCLIIGKQEI